MFSFLLPPFLLCVRGGNLLLLYYSVFSSEHFSLFLVLSRMIYGVFLVACLRCILRCGSSVGVLCLHV
jgi:hypothetical protein